MRFVTFFLPWGNRDWDSQNHSAAVFWNFAHQPKMSQLTLCSRKAAIFGAALLAGTGCSLCSKALLSIHGEDSEGNDEALASPPV